MMTTALPVDTADGLITLGLHLDAWEILESLPPADRLVPPVLALRLVICRELQMWATETAGVRRCRRPDLPESPCFFRPPVNNTAVKP